MNNELMMALTEVRDALVRLGTATVRAEGFEGWRARGAYNDLAREFNQYVRKTDVINPLAEIALDLEEEKGQTASEAFRLAH
jgi:hypothetical protein